MKQNISNDLLKYLKLEGYVVNDFNDLDGNLNEYSSLDSLALIKLILYLEEKYNIELDLSDLAIYNFETINKVTNIVVEHIERQ